MPDVDQFQTGTPLGSRREPGERPAGLVAKVQLLGDTVTVGGQRGAWNEDLEWFLSNRLWICVGF